MASIARAMGMRCAAIFYDLIPEKMQDLYSASQLEAMRRYWRGLASVDVALPISWTSAAELGRFLRSHELKRPRIIPCPLAGEAGAGQPTRASTASAHVPSHPLRLLAVGTWEPRKNHVRLLRAVGEAQKRATRPITLVLAGRQAGYAALDTEIEALAKSAGVEVLGAVDDAELFRQYEESDATVFSSWEEGFGLPVLESLWHGRPCLCHNGSAMVELIPGGGVLGLDMLDEDAIADALVRLADNPSCSLRSPTRQLGEGSGPGMHTPRTC